jgi:hypothetical protein
VTEPFAIATRERGAGGMGIGLGLGAPSRCAPPLPLRVLASATWASSSYRAGRLTRQAIRQISCAVVADTARDQSPRSYDRVGSGWPDPVRSGLPWAARTIGDPSIVRLRPESPDPGRVADELATTDGMLVAHVCRSAR